MEKFIIAAVVIIILAWVIKKRNLFKTLSEDIKRAGSEISVYEQKREDSLNDAMSIAKISYHKEVEGVERMTAKDKLDQLHYLGEKFPKLGATESYKLAVENAFALNDEITACRTTLNGNITEYNKVISSFPGLALRLQGREADRRREPGCPPPPEQERRGLLQLLITDMKCPGRENAAGAFYARRVWCRDHPGGWSLHMT